MSRGHVVSPVLVTSVALLTIAAGGWFGGYRLNLTPSEPLGLWQIEPLTRPLSVGDMVFDCPPSSKEFALAVERGYVHRGLCPVGVAPLIKTVVALSGQRVEIGSDVVIDRLPLPNSAVRPSDGAGRPLHPFAGGIVPSGHLFLHSDFASSYDSRYFGPVPETGLLGLARPVLTFDP
ncbi:conjugative transfer signal peptidase TraF [Phyllobacterium endophyticum]|uniref:Conjugative transfer signal peptidase TraF n=1 Tax=Phyllobacterium endophyticum TaxID=1149773 RepID=A0A2P7AKG3_9HYPH|nr:conjugative transfer signal peptidase TraF [Phyllobacterium endophyticum]MBB3237068.1 conjugative transfer signal peptidase TraF [Phyllobacterium endophyticum]PSH54692.1 conjugative transfer signal peptidase TraF [Phyllobacterium endophyticum]TYR40541.1 conjugative transfer signal peptidase TraF [Phyllobacterium endophyticum]